MRKDRGDQRRPAPARRRQRRRRWPICESTGKRRFRERKDAKAELERARHVRAHAELAGHKSSLTVVRAYRCMFCGGWHLTSRPSWDDSRDSAVPA